MRRFTLIDLISVVAANALGIAWVRSNWYFDAFKTPGAWIEEAPEMLGPVLMTWTVAVVLLRLMPPRPPMRRLVLQPGAAACGAVTIGFAIQCLNYFTLSYARMHRFPWVLFQAGGGVGPELVSNTLSGVPYHLLVSAAWVMLFLGRRCRPEPSWIDRAGRAIGVFWILLAFWTWSAYAIEAWREGVS